MRLTPEIDHFRCRQCAAVFSIARPVPVLWSEDWEALGYENAVWSDGKSWADTVPHVPVMYCDGCAALVWLDDCLLEPASFYRQESTKGGRHITISEGYDELERLDADVSGQSANLQNLNSFSPQVSSASDPTNELGALWERRYIIALHLLHRLNDDGRAPMRAVELKPPVLPQPQNNAAQRQLVLRCLLQTDLLSSDEEHRLRCAEWLRESGEFNLALQILNEPFFGRKNADVANQLHTLAASHVSQVANITPWRFKPSQHALKKEQLEEVKRDRKLAEFEELRVAQVADRRRKQAAVLVVERCPRNFLESVLGTEGLTVQKSLALIEEKLPKQIKLPIHGLVSQFAWPVERLPVAICEALIRNLGYPNTTETVGPSGIWTFDEQEERFVNYLQQLFAKTTWNVWWYTPVKAPWPRSV